MEYLCRRDKLKGRLSSRRTESWNQRNSGIIDEINTSEEDRVLSGIAEFDRVLGGGLVAGSVILIGGDPGIGNQRCSCKGSLR